MRSLVPTLRRQPSNTVSTPRAPPILRMSSLWPLIAKHDVLAATRSPSIHDKAFSKSSLIPSLRNSFSRSELMFTNGSTAMDLCCSRLGWRAGVDVSRLAAATFLVSLPYLGLACVDSMGGETKRRTPRRQRRRSTPRRQNSRSSLAAAMHFSVPCHTLCSTAFAALRGRTPPISAPAAMAAVFCTTPCAWTRQVAKKPQVSICTAGQ
jgi:hypothetical protein